MNLGGPREDLFVMSIWEVQRNLKGSEFVSITHISESCSEWSIMVDAYHIHIVC
jgi:hypothetical protein